MGLKEYKEKRDFCKTPEPKESRPKKKSDVLIYVIQKHQAAHLHYDLRLEEEGVLKSWAIPKTPPLREGLRRLAVQTEDHPLGYEEFEGTIPEGTYGAGKVEVWDKGHYLPLEKAPVKRVVEIRGDKLSGVYGLIKLKAKHPEDNNWLFFKMKGKKANSSLL